ncbi:MAG: serine hydrolase [Deltaproteobacteria bacterium]|nr:serine hydrolase [Deltaproteobacteria bacterium]
MHRSKQLVRVAAAIGVFLALALPRAAVADETTARLPSPAELWLRTVQPDSELQELLDQRVEALRKRDRALKQHTIRVSIMDIPTNGPPTLAHWKGDSPVYPASVPKFAYLMAVYHWRDQGKLDIDPAFDRQLTQMVYSSSNRATQKVVARLTNTQPGPRLEPEEYSEFVEKRHAVKRWLRELGITDLHLVHPTYDGGGDLYGREEQFLEDTEIEGCLPDQTGEYRNRAAMTTNGSAELLALLATDRALSPETSAEVRERMRRSTRKQGYLKRRIAGGAEQCGIEGVEIFAKTGTWGPITADAGIVRAPSGRQLIVAAFVEGAPRYKGNFIAKVAEAGCELVFARDEGI